MVRHFYRAEIHESTRALDFKTLVLTEIPSSQVNGGIQMSYTPRSLFRILEDIDAQRLLLPHIQRPFVWEREQMARLFDQLDAGISDSDIPFLEN